MVFSPITSWQIEGENVEAVTGKDNFKKEKENYRPIILINIDANFLTNVKTQNSAIYNQELYTRQSRVHAKDGKLVSI